MLAAMVARPKERTPAPAMTPWANSIVRYGEEAPDQLLAFPLNPKIHPQAQQQALAGALGELGWLMPVVCNETTGHILDGHARVGLAISRGEPRVPVAYVRLSPEQEALAVATIDPIGALAGTDRDVLAQLLADVQSGEIGLRALLDDLAVQAGIVPEVADDPGPQVDRAAELQEQWGTSSGQLWEIPSMSVPGKAHRLLCGDSLDPIVLERLTADLAVGMVWADPPYGVSIVATNVAVGGGEANDIPFGGRKAPRSGAFAGYPMSGRRGNVGGGAAHIARTGATYMETNKARLGSANGAKPFGDAPVRGSDGATNIVPVGKYLPVKGDDTTETAIASYLLCAERWPGAAHVWWGGNYYADALPPSSCWLVWNKENGENNFADCELAWTNQKTVTRMFTHRWNGMLRASERERRMHPTQKPAALAAWAMEKYAAADAVVLDPFVGAGMSLVAAEQTGRIGAGVEYEASYVAVTLERLAGMGLTPRLISHTTDTVSAVPTS